MLFLCLKVGIYMASIQKRGNSYQITVSKEYDIAGKKLLETTFYTRPVLGEAADQAETAALRG